MRGLQGLRCPKTFLHADSIDRVNGVRLSRIRNSAESQRSIFDRLADDPQIVAECSVKRRNKKHLAFFFVGPIRHESFASATLPRITGIVAQGPLEGRT